MYPTLFSNLEEVQHYLLDQITYNDTNGFSFSDTNIMSSWDSIVQQLGSPTTSNMDSIQQQTMYYTGLIDHPTQGTRPHHKLEVLFLAYNDQALSNIRLDLSYFSFGAYSITFKEFTHKLIADFIDKFGKPDKKSLRIGREEIKYKKGKFSFSLIRNTQGLRILIK